MEPELAFGSYESTTVMGAHGPKVGLHQLAQRVKLMST